MPARQSRPASRQKVPSRIREAETAGRPLGAPASRRHRAKYARAVYEKPRRQGGMPERRIERELASDRSGIVARRPGPVSSLQYAVAVSHPGVQSWSRRTFTVNGRDKRWFLSRSTTATDACTAARFVEGRGVLDVGCRRDAGAPRWASDGLPLVVHGCRSFDVGRRESESRQRQRHRPSALGHRRPPFLLFVAFCSHRVALDQAR